MLVPNPCKHYRRLLLCLYEDSFKFDEIRVRACSKMSSLLVRTQIEAAQGNAGHLPVVKRFFIVLIFSREGDRTHRTFPLPIILGDFFAMIH